jgi:hypothetical protein
MKLLRMVFWLGIVIYNLPNDAASNARPSQPHGENVAARAAGQFEALSKRGDLGGNASLRDVLEPSQDTLTPADRAVRWSGLPKVQAGAYAPRPP